MQQLIKLTIKLFLTCFISSISALPIPSPVPGGIVQLKLPYTDKQVPEVTFNQKNVAVILKEGAWYALIGIPLDVAPGMQSAQLISPVQEKISFKIYNKSYPIQKLKIKNKRMVEPNQEDLKRIDSEQTVLQKILSKRTAPNPFSEEFVAPLTGKISSAFGLQRVYNEIPSSPHKGLDIAAPAENDINAIRSGIVVLNQDLYYTGNTIIIDHGQGVFSLYAHCNKTLVEVGRHVSSGQIIAKVGKTGRATGPHLHLETIMNEARVDPLLLIDKEKILPKVKKEHPNKKTKKRK